MTRPHLSLVAVLATGVLVAAGCGGGSKSSSSGSGNLGSGVVATVAGTKITRAALDDLMKTAELTYKQNKQAFPKPGTTEYQSLQQQAAVYLVTQAEYEQQATKLGVTVTTADVTKALNDLVKQRFKGDRKKFDAYLKTTGYSMAQFETIEHRQVLGTKLSKAITKDVKVTPAEIKAYYDKNKSSTPYTTPAQRRVRHILVALNAKGVGVADKGVTDTKVDFAKSKQLADELYAKLHGGTSFVTLVKKYSQDPGSKDKGGAYTDVKGTFVKEFEASAFSLKTHEISKPVKSQFGYHLIQALAPTKPAQTLTLAQATASIRKLLLQQKQQAELQKWAAGLGQKYKGKVTYAAGFQPPAPTGTTAATTTG
jgi:parvulin-like peptidyl-prolyl isomerase